MIPPVFMRDVSSGSISIFETCDCLATAKILRCHNSPNHCSTPFERRLRFKAMREVNHDDESVLGSQLQAGHHWRCFWD